MLDKRTPFETQPSKAPRIWDLTNSNGRRDTLVNTTEALQASIGKIACLDSSSKNSGLGWNYYGTWENTACWHWFDMKKPAIVQVELAIQHSRSKLWEWCDTLCDRVCRGGSFKWYLAGAHPLLIGSPFDNKQQKTPENLTKLLR